MRKNILKILSVIFAITMVFTIMPITTFAETNGDFEYAVLDNGTAEITDYTGSAEHVDIPSEIDGYEVSRIGDRAFSWCFDTSSVTIPNSVISIGANAFLNSGIQQPNNYINGVFYIDDCLIVADSQRVSAEYKIKDGTRLIADNAFDACLRLSKVTIPGSVKNIGVSAFARCDYLTNVELSEGIISIEKSAFRSCDALASVTIPSTVAHIGEGAFSRCGFLKNITVAENNMSYLTDDVGVLFSNDKTELIQYPVAKSRTEYTIPDGVKRICYGAFEGATSLKNIIISDSVTVIDDSAFSDCSNLTDIKIPNAVTSIGDESFYGCSNLTSVIFGKNIKSIGTDAFFACYNLKDVYYSGTTDDWDNIDMTTVNSFFGYGFVGVNIHFNSTGPEEEPTTQEPTTEEPATQPPTTEPTEPNTEPEETELLPKDGSDITLLENNVAQIKAEQSISDILAQLENESVKITDKDSKVLTDTALIGTGSKIQVLDKDGNVLSEYTVLVPMDINGDGKISASDARSALRVSAKLDELEGVFLAAANADGNDKITAADARKILRVSAKLETA